MSVQPLNDLRTDSVEELLFELQMRHERAPSEPIPIDLSALSRLERPAGALLSNLLVAALDDAHIVLRLPDRERIHWLTASGLAFAIGNRSGTTELDGPLAPGLERWRKPWSAGTTETWESMTGPALELFEPVMVGETALRPHLFGRDQAAFVDPHLVPVESAPSHPLGDVIWPWLDRLLPRSRSGVRKVARTSFIADVGRLVAETVGNVREHAVGGPRRLHSLVQLAVTRGGRDSPHRLHLIVQDNGPGIATTARGKVTSALRASLSDHQLLFKLCDGSLPPWGRARGMGLPTVVETVRELGGTFRLWTKTTRVRADAQAVPLTAGDGLARVDGTVLAIMLPLPA